ncbi:MAG: hypothetical protein AB1635_18900, partial [Acidobacteriota bacterium]
MSRLLSILMLSLAILVPSAGAQPAATLRLVSGAIDAAGTLGVPLTNGSGIAIADVPVTVHTEDTRLFVTRWEPAPAPVLVASGAGGATIAARDAVVMVVYVDLAAGSISSLVSV